MALRKINKCYATAKHLIFKCLPIHNGRSTNLKNLVANTLLKIDSEKLVARSINVHNFPAECP